jgi:hypothetical protein
MHSASSRRRFLHQAGLVVGGALAFPHVRAAQEPVLGQGDFRYRVVPGWGNLGAETPVNDCHGLAVDREGHVILFTNETRNNVIVYDRQGRLVSKWGREFPGAHGLSLVVENGREVLFLTDHVDDFWTNVTLNYGDTPFRSVTRAGADLEKFPLEGEEAKKEEPADSGEIDGLRAAMKMLYGDRVREVRTTHKLSQTPICLATGEGDMDMRMERFLAEHKQLPKRAAKIVEINPSHEVIKSLAARVKNSGLNSELEDALYLLLDQALIAEGEPVTDAGAFARRLGALMSKGLAA